MYTANKTMGTSAYNWGDSLDMTDVPESMHLAYMENVLMTRMLFAMNPDMLETGKGAANADGSAVAIPNDITALSAGSASTGTANAGTTGSSVSSDPASTASPSPSSAAPSASATTSKSGAMSRSVASVSVIGVVALIVSLLGM